MLEQRPRFAANIYSICQATVYYLVNVNIIFKSSGNFNGSHRGFFIIRVQIRIVVHRSFVTPSLRPMEAWRHFYLTLDYFIYRHS